MSTEHEELDAFERSVPTYARPGECWSDLMLIARRMADALTAERAAREKAEAAYAYLLSKADRFKDGIDWIQSAMQAEAHRDALAARLAEAEREIHIVFDGPPGHEGGRFVEVEDANGKSICFGRWEQRGAYWHLIADAARKGDPPDNMWDTIGAPHNVERKGADDGQ